LHRWRPARTIEADLGLTSYRALTSDKFYNRFTLSTAATIVGNERRKPADSVLLSVLPTRIHKIVGPSLLAARKKRKVSIFGDQDCCSRNSFVPNLKVGRALQVEIANVDYLVAAITKRRCQRRRKLRVDQKKQSLFRRDDRMVSLTGRKGQDRIDVGAFEIGIIPKDRLSRLARRQQAQNIRYGNTQAANARPAVHALGVYRDPR
jgi:hypothetical protein